MNIMNKNINLVEILKDCPKGTKFYSPIFGEAVFDHIHHNEIIVYMKTGNMRCFNRYGQYICKAKFTEGECMLFPSKEERDWNKYTPIECRHDFKPFERVLCRNSSNEKWIAGLFSHYSKDIDNQDMFVTVGDCYYYYCIPYADNEHLLGTEKSEYEEDNV